MYVYVCICMYVCMYMCVYVCIYMYVCTPENIDRVTEWRRAERCGLLSMASITTTIFSGVRTVFTLPPFFFSVEPIASKFRTQVLMACADGTDDCDESRTLFEIDAERSQNCHRFCKTLSQQKYLVLQSTAPLQLKRFKLAANWR